MLLKIKKYRQLKNHYLPPDILPMEASDSTNISKTGNGDFPIRKVLEVSVVQEVDKRSLGTPSSLWELLFICNPIKHYFHTKICRIVKTKSTFKQQQNNQSNRTS